MEKNQQPLPTKPTTPSRKGEKLPIFCADVTKLIAADSWLGRYASNDPEAATAFSEITSVLTNPVDIYFQKRRVLDTGHLGFVAKTWIDASNVDSAESALLRGGESIIMDAERARWFSTSFRAKVAHQAVDWIRFQASNPTLMKVAWADNSEQEHETSYAALIENDVGLRPLRRAFRSASRELQIPLLDASNRALAELGKRPLASSWDDEKLCIAYLAWAYVKGFRYVHTIKSAHPASSYMVHFLRRAAIEHETVPTGNSEPVTSLFPWGDLIGIEAFKGTLSEGYSDVIDSLRVYTRQELAGYLTSITDLRRRLPSERARERTSTFRDAVNFTREFASEGLTRAALWQRDSVIEGRRKTADRLIDIVSFIFTASLLFKDPSLISVASFYLDLLFVKAPLKETIRQKIMVWNVRREMRNKLREKHDAISQYLQRLGINAEP